VACFDFRKQKCTGLFSRAVLATRMGDDRNVPTIEQCKKRAAEYKTLGKDPKISARRSAVLLSISRSWAALANQLEFGAMAPLVLP
jgi:hypothetical protein